MKKVKQYKTKDISGNSNFYVDPTDKNRTKVVFELNDKELSLIGGVEFITINDTLTLELNKRLHLNKEKSIDQLSRKKQRRFRFVVIDTQLCGKGIQPKDLNIDSNYNTIFEFDDHKITKVTSIDNTHKNWWYEGNKTDDYDKDFEELEIYESEVMSKKEQLLNTIQQYKDKQMELSNQRDFVEVEIKNYQDKIIKCLEQLKEMK